MIRSVIMVDVKPGTSDEQIEALFTALAAVPFEKRRAFSYGRDLGIAANTMDLIMVSDFDDRDAYRAWVADPAHRAVSTQMLHPIAERIVRGQFEL
jgi:hypothetical protein